MDILIPYMYLDNVFKDKKEMNTYATKDKDKYILLSEKS